MNVIHQNLPLIVHRIYFISLSQRCSFPFRREFQTKKPIKAAIIKNVRRVKSRMNLVAGEIRKISRENIGSSPKKYLIFLLRKRRFLRK